MNSSFTIGLDASFMMTFDEDYTLKYLTAAETTGFDHLWLGDHWLPWHHSFKHSFFVWEVLAVVAARTRHIKVGPDVTVPLGGRYHPALIAQASVTMDNMFPGRFVLGIGSGEAMNEERFLGRWPRWRERMDRMEEGIELIKRLWTETDYFDFDGRYFKMKMAFQHLKPKTQIPIYFSSVGEKSAYEAGKFADRLLCVGTVDRVRDVMFPSFEAGARSVGREPDNLEKAVLIDMATGEEKEIAERMRKYSIGSTISSMFNEKDPRKIEAAGSALSDEEVLGNLYTFQRGEQVIEVLERYRKLGASQVIIGDMSVDPDRAMKIYAEQVIPYFRGNRH